MRLGFALPHSGTTAGPDGIRAVARRAEELGYDSLWTADRLLYPIAPRAKYSNTPDGRLPTSAKRVLDPVGTLVFAAACTERVKLGTSIVNIPFHNPVVLARELSTLDILSGGRLLAGFGTGWSPDEYEAAGVDWSTRGARTDEALDLLVKLWTEEETEHAGRFFRVPRSIVLKPIQKPRPPIYLAAFTPAAMKRVAERADGWNPIGSLGPGRLKEMFASIRAMAAAAGRDPATLQLIVRANTQLTSTPIGRDRLPFVGAAAEIRDDIAALREIGVDEVLFAVAWRGPSGHLEQLEELWALAH
jgi:probable F420-dependent oxidoreductase